MVLERRWLRWLVAAAVFLAAFGTNVVLQPLLDGRAPLLPFFPALVIAGLFSGVRPALAVVAASSLAVLDYWIEPVGQIWPIRHVSDAILIAFFLIAGSLVAVVSSWVGDLMRRERLARRQLDSALRASRDTEERLHLALQSGRVIAWECDRDGQPTWLYVPPGAWPQDVVDRLLRGDASRGVFVEAVQAACATGQTQTFAEQVERDGRAYHFLTSMRPAPQLDGSPRLLGATADVTELAEAQAGLREEARRKDAFLATLAHELRNPMAPIRYAMAILRQAPQAPQRERALDIISRQSAHMARLLDDLLDISRITRDVIKLHTEVLDLRAVASQALDAAALPLAEREQATGLVLPPEPVWVTGDATRLQQVLGNLLDNAAKFSTGPGQVGVQLEVEADTAVLSVSDTGRGIPAPLRGRVFDMFARVDSSEHAPSGLGIGLALCRRLVELHGGTIDVASGPAGLGSRFTVRLPLAPAPQAPAPAPAPPGAAVTALPAGTPVLVVDDNVDAAHSLAESLRHAGCAVAVAFDGAQALQRYAQARQRVVLLDIGLPDLSGLEVARRLRQQAAGAPLALIAISGWGQPSDREATTRAGFDDHLVKPVEFGALAARIVQRLHQPHGEPLPHR
jgi:two-component system CheB/CheR fusion protein